MIPKPVRSNEYSKNCRGLGNLRTSPILKSLIRSSKPNVIILFETLVLARRVEEVRVKVGFDFCFTVDRLGHGGGIVVLWRSTVQCTIIKFAQNFVNVEITDANIVGRWRLMDFMGCQKGVEGDNLGTFCGSYLTCHNYLSV